MTTKHPEDVAIETAGRAFSKTQQALDVASRVATGEELRALLTTYPDSDAHEALDRLRERFWIDDEVFAATEALTPKEFRVEPRMTRVTKGGKR